MPAALGSLKGKLPGTVLQKITLAHSLAVWSDDDASVARVGWGMRCERGINGVSTINTQARVASVVRMNAMIPNKMFY